MFGFGKRTIKWTVKDENGEPVAVHESDGSGYLNPKLVWNGIQYETEGQMKTAQEQASASAYFAQKFAEMDAEEAKATAEKNSTNKDLDIDGTDVSGWWF